MLRRADAEPALKPLIQLSDRDAGHDAPPLQHLGTLLHGLHRRQARLWSRPRCPAALGRLPERSNSKAVTQSLSAGAEGDPALPRLTTPGMMAHGASWSGGSRLTAAGRPRVSMPYPNASSRRSPDGRRRSPEPRRGPRPRRPHREWLLRPPGPRGGPNRMRPSATGAHTSPMSSPLAPAGPDGGNNPLLGSLGLPRPWPAPCSAGESEVVRTTGSLELRYRM